MKRAGMMLPVLETILSDSADGGATVTCKSRFAIASLPAKSAASTRNV